VSWKGSLAPLANRNFGWYYASRFVDTIGTSMGMIALAFAVLDVTDDSATAVGQVMAAHTVPLVVFMLWGGVIADRLPRTLVIQASNLLAAASFGLLAYLFVSDRAELWMIIVLAAVNGLADALGFPAMASMVPQLVPRDQLQSANALISMSRGAISIIGPSFGALLVVTVGSGWALAANAMTWILSAAFLFPVAIPPKPPKAEEEKTSTLQDLREGWTFFARTTWLWVIVLAFGFLNAIHVGAIFTLGPALAKETFGEQGWGLVLSAESAGLLLMTVILLRVRIRRPLLVGMVAISLEGILMLTLGLEPNVLYLVPMAFLAGAGIELFSIGWSLAMQENIEDRMLSRAYSYDALGSFVAMPIGQLAYGPLGEAFGYRNVFVVSGIAYIGICLLSLTSRSVRQLERAPADIQPATTA
jgi:MFS family permease